MLLCSSGIRELAAEIPDIQKWTQASALPGSERYVQFVAQLKRRIAPVYDQKIRRFFVSCLRYLEVSDSTDKSAIFLSLSLSLLGRIACMHLFVCLFVCLLAYLIIHMPKFHEIFSTC